MIDDDAREARLFGEVRTDLPVRALADALQSHGLDARRRESSLFTGGEYVRILPDDVDVDASLERVAPGEYLVQDAGGDPAAMAALARALTDALTALDLTHRLELYAEADENALTAYHAHRWPADAG
jgi:sarcosine oxidase gamma subunit